MGDNEVYPGRTCDSLSHCHLACQEHSDVPKMCISKTLCIKL